MATETERKFLVEGESDKALAERRRHIEQFYLSARPEATVRVRIADGRAWLTVKGLTRGCSRAEYEYEVPVADAEGMRVMAEGRVVEKTRWVVPAGDSLKWEVDEFHGALAGLTVAEIEVPEENTVFERPEFVGREVTGDARYYNSSLALDTDSPL